jgi:hypothetical protein
LLPMPTPVCGKGGEQGSCELFLLAKLCFLSGGGGGFPSEK